MSFNRNENYKMLVNHSNGKYHFINSEFTEICRSIVLHIQFINTSIDMTIYHHHFSTKPTIYHHHATNQPQILKYQQQLLVTEFRSIVTGRNCIYYFLTETVTNINRNLLHLDLDNYYIKTLYYCRSIRISISFFVQSY